MSWVLCSESAQAEIKVSARAGILTWGFESSSRLICVGRIHFLWWWDWDPCDLTSCQLGPLSFPRCLLWCGCWPQSPHQQSPTVPFASFHASRTLSHWLPTAPQLTMMKTYIMWYNHRGDYPTNICHVAWPSPGSYDRLSHPIHKFGLHPKIH